MPIDNIAYDSVSEETDRMVVGRAYPSNMTQYIIDLALKISVLEKALEEAHECKEKNGKCNSCTGCACTDCDSE